jgi:hypothetical protein
MCGKVNNMTSDEAQQAQ